MEPRQQGCLMLALFLQLLLLLLFGAQGQGSTPGRCDCARDSQRRYGPFCCRGCPMGHYMKDPCTEPCGDSTCLPCPRGTFLNWENHSKTDCTRCQVCDEEAFQVTLENCSAVSDTLCGCPPGWFPDCSTEPCRNGSPFTCSCPDRETTTPRSCPPGSYPHGHGCLLCPTSFSGVCPDACTAVCGRKQMFWVQVLLGASFLLGATLICTYCRRQPCKPVAPDYRQHTPLLAPPASTGTVCTTVQLVGNSWTTGLSQTQEVACRQASQPWNQLPDRTLAPPAGSPAAVLQPGPQIYDVMDAVPARRWKEFVRTLGLREAEIEAVEVEICRFRDQQYEMLKRWRQQQPAGLGAIYAALERMGLEGCAEDLRSACSVARNVTVTFEGALSIVTYACRHFMSLTNPPGMVLRSRAACLVPSYLQRGVPAKGSILEN